jgi:hypothetical protein
MMTRLTRIRTPDRPPAADHYLSAATDDIIPWDRVVELSVIDSAQQGVSICVVCGDRIAAGQGVTARYEGHTLRFRCQGCLGRFAEDPARFLAGRMEQWCSDGPRDSATRSN